MEIVITALVTIGVSVFLAETYAWIPKLSELCIRLAVSLLLPEDRERYLEEWRADIGAQPTSILRLANAASLTFAAISIKSGSVGVRLTEIGLQLDALTEQSINIRNGFALLERQRESREAFQQRLAHVVGDLLSEDWPPSLASTTNESGVVDPVKKAAYVKALTSLHGLGSELEANINRCIEITDHRINSLMTLAEHADAHLRSMLAEYSRAEELYRRRRWAQSTAALNALDDELRAESDYNIQHPKMDVEYDKRMAAVSVAITGCANQRPTILRS